MRFHPQTLRDNSILLTGDGFRRIHQGLNDQNKDNENKQKQAKYNFEYEFHGSLLIASYTSMID